MIKKTETNPRRDFLKKITIAAATIGTFSFIKNKKSSNYPEEKIKTLSRTEADEIIKKEKFSISKTLKPAPAPNKHKNIPG